MTDRINSADTMQRDTIGDMLTQRPEGTVTLAARYQIVRKLGEGGMGSVWLAEDTKLDGRQVAIKMLPVVLAANKRAIQQLKAEAKLAIQLAHPNIATVRGFEESDEGPFLVIDFIPGQTLEDLLAERGGIPEDKISRLFTPIADALDYAHGQKVIHRDIKPSNILIRDDGPPSIGDFGIARQMKDTMTRVTGRSTSGTLPYMSPEQLRGEAPTPAQDIYSLAATMYECVMGHPPFFRGRIEHQIENVDPDALPSESPLSLAVTQALAKSPSDRPPNARAILCGEMTGPRPVGAKIPGTSGGSQNGSAGRRPIQVRFWEDPGRYVLQHNWILASLFAGLVGAGIAFYFIVDFSFDSKKELVNWQIGLLSGIPVVLAALASLLGNPGPPEQAEDRTEFFASRLLGGALIGVLCSLLFPLGMIWVIGSEIQKKAQKGQQEPPPEDT